MSMIEVVGSPMEAPGPEASTEANLRSVLQGLDGLLDVKWVPLAMWNAVKSRWEGRYALIVNWPMADARWSMVQSGEVNPKLAHDIVGWLCENMQDPASMPTSLMGIEQRVIDLLGTMDNERYPWKQRLQSAVDKNRKVHATNKSDALDFVHDEAEYQYRRAKGIPQVQGADFNSKGKLL
jgi:hypothetical protein